jgi:sugar (pentulose or hexulose) kinase
VTGRAVRWLNIAEWVVKRLGGDEVAEPSLSSRTGMLDLHARAPYADALAWAGLREDLLPPLAEAGTPAGRAILPEARGALLTVAGHDHLVAGVGVGVVAPGDALDSCGTAEALARIVAPPLSPEQVLRALAGDVSVGWHVAPGRQALQAALWSGLALREVLAALGVEDGARSELGALAAAAPLEDAPVVELDLRAAVRRPLRLPAAEPHLVWKAAIDATAREAQRVLAHIDAVAGEHGKLVITGGLARDPAFLAAKRERGGVSAPPVLEAGCRGAALLAGVAAGVYPDVDHLPPLPAR